MHGYGYFAWTNGDVYSGNWSNGKLTGYGVKTCADGTSEKGPSPPSLLAPSFPHERRRVLGWPTQCLGCEGSSIEVK
jgi:hypothetical protein